jgi:hypothetical protein
MVVGCNAYTVILYQFALYPNSSVAPALSVTAVDVDWLASLGLAHSIATPLGRPGSPELEGGTTSAFNNSRLGTNLNVLKSKTLFRHKFFSISLALRRQFLVPKMLDSETMEAWTGRIHSMVLRMEYAGH